VCFTTHLCVFPPNAGDLDPFLTYYANA
jgi:hypothetical protein